MNFKALFYDVSLKYEFKRCTSLEDIRTCLKLRHKVYCEEKGWEAAQPDMMESDYFDSHSFHILVVCRESGESVATFRLIQDKNMPIVKYMPDNHIMHPKNNAHNSVCELSRFSILKSHRGLELTTVLMLIVGYETSKLGYVGVYMVMERSLARIMRKLDLGYQKLTEDFNLKGKRAVYFSSVADLVKPLSVEIDLIMPQVSALFDPLFSRVVEHEKLVS